MKMDYSKSNNLKKFKTCLFSILLVMLATSSVQAQNDAKFTVRFKLLIHDGDYKNAVITITKNGAPFKVIDGNGNITSVDLDLNSEYTVTCTKMGYITKALTYNTKVPGGRASDEFAKFKCVVELFPQPEDAIVTFSQPVGRIQYSIELNDFDYDKNYAQTALEMQKQAAEHPTPAAKPPPPPRVVAPPPPPPPPKPEVVSKPIPVEIKQPEVVHEPPPPVKKREAPPVVPEKKIEKNSIERIFQDDRKKTTVITVTINNVDFVYKKEEYNWGAVYFYKNNVYITETTYRTETE